MKNEATSRSQSQAAEVSRRGFLATAGGAAAVAAAAVGPGAKGATAAPATREEKLKAAL